MLRIRVLLLLAVIGCLQPSQVSVGHYCYCLVETAAEYCPWPTSSPSLTLGFLLQARDACLERPWQEGVSITGATAPSVTISLTTFEEIQQHIDNTTGPTTFIINAKQLPLPAGQTVQISKPDITIAAAAEFVSSSSAGSRSKSSTDGPLQLAVDCTKAGSLLQIR
jgi:hypothetical protein